MSYSLDGLPYDEREDVIREIGLEPRSTKRTQDGLSVFKPKETPEPGLVLKDASVACAIWQMLTPVQRLVAQGVVVGGKGFVDVAEELSDEFMKVHPDDVALAHQCACDVVRSVAVQC